MGFGHSSDNRSSGDVQSATIHLRAFNGRARYFSTTDSKDGKAKCEIFNDVGKNDLAINDIVVKNAETNIACVRARFSLAIKVESVTPGKVIVPPTTTDNSQSRTANATNDLTPAETPEPEVLTEDIRMVLGYLPLDSVISVDDSCPSVKQSPVEGETDDNATKVEDNNELEMIVRFECGKLAFTFKQDESFYVSSIKGVVNLDSIIVREFIADKPLFFTSDLNHHFKYNDLVEVHSSAKTKAFILTANFYQTEIESFRKTTNRDFVRPPDENSKPYKEE